KGFTPRTQRRKRKARHGRYFTKIVAIAALPLRAMRERFHATDAKKKTQSTPRKLFHKNRCGRCAIVAVAARMVSRHGRKENAKEATEVISKKSLRTLRHRCGRCEKWFTPRTRRKRKARHGSYFTKIVADVALSLRSLREWFHATDAKKTQRKPRKLFHKNRCDRRVIVAVAARRVSRHGREGSHVSYFTKIVVFVALPLRALREMVDATGVFIHEWHGFSRIF
ncbi:hypothetical protein, partial [Lunatibacter salilacus]|uniref:hypothetical protein n=1 Tax=Lunatibacter salilacus TaxID=2483804 RepID=UPI00131C5420